MKTTKPVIRSEARLVAKKEKHKPNTVNEPPVCYNCERNSISPHETQLCDECADEIRFRPRI